MLINKNMSAFYCNLLFSSGGSFSRGSLSSWGRGGSSSSNKDWSTAINWSWGIGTDWSIDWSWGISTDWSRGIGWSWSRGIGWSWSRGISWSWGSIGNWGTLVLDISDIARESISNIVGDNLDTAIRKSNTVTTSSGVSEIDKIFNVTQ